MSKDKENAAPSVDPSVLKGSEVARSVMGTGAAPEGFRVDFRDGIATLTGSVQSEEQRNQVLQAARSVGGVASVKDSLQIAGSPKRSAGLSQTYTVQSGDTLSAIAQKYYRDASEYKRIFEANRSVLSDPDDIKAGQLLMIPE